jgi:hypothetical protein
MAANGDAVADAETDAANVVPAPGLHDIPEDERLHQEEPSDEHIADAEETVGTLETAAADGAAVDDADFVYQHPDLARFAPTEVRADDEVEDEDGESMDEDDLDAREFWSSRAAPDLEKIAEMGPTEQVGMRCGPLAAVRSSLLGVSVAQSALELLIWAVTQALCQVGAFREQVRGLAVANSLAGDLHGRLRNSGAAWADLAGLLAEDLQGCEVEDVLDAMRAQSGESTEQLFADFGSLMHTDGPFNQTLREAVTPEARLRGRGSVLGVNLHDLSRVPHELTILDSRSSPQRFRLAAAVTREDCPRVVVQNGSGSRAIISGHERISVGGSVEQPRLAYGFYVAGAARGAAKTSALMQRR